MKLKRKVIISVIISLVLSACVSSATDTSCINAELYKCNSVDPRGTLKNNCDKTIWMAKVVVSLYDVNENKLDADEEYIEDLAPGSEKDFEAVFGNEFEGKVARCKVVVESAKFE